MATIIDWIDTRLNVITMYRLVLYYLIALLVVAVGFSFVGILPYDPYAFLFSIGFLLAVCSITNWVFSKAFHVPANAESTHITALILALIITPLQSNNDLWFLAWAGVLAIASKYILAINKRHIFNPAAFAVALTYLTINQDASWWIGSAPMLPFVLIGGILMVRKLGRFELVLSFLAVTSVASLGLSLLNGDNLFTALGNLILSSPLFFFAFVILTEPLTTPPTQPLRLVYGVLVGFLFTPQIHLGAFYTTPEIAILLGNVFSYLVSPKTRRVLSLARKVRLAPDIYDFVFEPTRPFAFAPGQYMEWTLGHDDPDSRGNRRYFTLASAPTEKVVRLGVKFYDNSSSFKEAMLDMEKGEEIVASHIAGDFTLPHNPKQKCVFIAGGIGITPFRSMIKYLLDTRQPRPIVLFYANRSVNDVVYTDVFERARKELGIKTVYTVTEPRDVPLSWQGERGYITAEMIRRKVPHYANCIFYISGPLRLIESTQEVLRELHVPGRNVKTDFFMGLAKAG